MINLRLPRGALARFGFGAAILLAAFFAAYGRAHASDGAPAHAHLRHHPPDLILAAIMLAVAAYAVAILVKQIWWENR